MRFNFLFFVLILLMISCKENHKTEPKKKDQKFVLQLQPFSDMKTQEVENIAKQIRLIYPEVAILEKIDFPKNSYYQKRNRYRADSIIQFLSLQTGNGFVKIGLTHKDISATKGNIEDFGVMGLGYRPGKSCVASSFRLNPAKRESQFYKIIIHEIGHTQGLPHCPEKTCFMRSAEGGNPTDEEKDFCPKCKKHLKSKNWKFS